jgi:4a-hydroxytetrahydrobiopterin dehydratase
MMVDAIILPDGWKPVANPPCLFRRYEFGSYAETREFLDGLATISKESAIYPDLGFGKTYVNVTLHGERGATPSGSQIEYACRANVMASAGPR